MNKGLLILISCICIRFIILLYFISYIDIYDYTFTNINKYK